MIKKLFILFVIIALTTASLMKTQQAFAVDGQGQPCNEDADCQPTLKNGFTYSRSDCGGTFNGVAADVCDPQYPQCKNNICVLQCSANCGIVGYNNPGTIICNSCGNSLYCPNITPAPTSTSTPTPTEVTPVITSTPTITPTPTECVAPGQVLNVKVTCPYCGGVDPTDGVNPNPSVIPTPSPTPTGSI